MCHTGLWFWIKRCFVMPGFLISRPQSNYPPLPPPLASCPLPTHPAHVHSHTHTHTTTSSDLSLTEQLLNKISAQGINNVKDSFLYQMLCLKEEYFVLAERPKYINHLRGRDGFGIFNTRPMSRTRDKERDLWKCWQTQRGYVLVF